MVTNPEKVAPEPTKAERAVAKAEAGLRIIVAGSDVGAVRRILLYGVSFTTMFLAALASPSGLGGALGVVGLGALVLLVATDDYR